MACRPPGRAAPAWRLGGEPGHGAATTGHHRAQPRPRRAAGRAGPTAAGRGQEPRGRGAGAAVRPERGRGLAEELWWEAAPTARDVAEHFDQLAPTRRWPDPVWSQVRIPVDGRPVGFQWLAEGRHVVAHAELDDRTLTLRGRDLPWGRCSWWRSRRVATGCCCGCWPPACSCCCTRHLPPAGTSARRRPTQPAPLGEARKVGDGVGPLRGWP